MKPERILVVDDDAAVRKLLRAFLEQHGFEVVELETCAELLATIESQPVDLALLDNHLQDGYTVELIPRLKKSAPEVPLVMLTGQASIEVAVQAIKLGADQFLTKPVELEALRVIVCRLLKQRREQRSLRARATGPGQQPPTPFVGSSPEIRSLERQAKTVVGSGLPILVLGETGAGKGVLARWLHDHSPRASEAFVDVNCAGLGPEFLESELFGHERGSFTGAVDTKKGLFEVAHRGTVFLDEIGDMRPAVQAKLLKILEEKRFRRLGGVRDRQVDIRLIAATNRNLSKEIDKGTFREDLYYRISVIPLEAPPLRQRRDDIAELAAVLLARIGAESARGPLCLSTAALAKLEAHNWPGNIRELKNVLERAALFATSHEIDPETLLLVERTVSTALDTSLTLQALEERYIGQVLEEEDGRISRAAKRLGIHRSTLYDKLKRSDATAC